MKIIANYFGGSQSYGLSTPESDKDERFLFLNTEISTILGLDRHDHQNTLNKTEDSQGFELRHALNLLKKGNSQLLEMIHNTNWIIHTPELARIIRDKEHLISSEKLFKCLLGYLNGEKHIIMGKTTGKLGEKRKQQIKKFGYSYRNCVHALRLARTGIIFFSDNIYPVNIVKQDEKYGKFIRDIKLNPQNHKVDDLLGLVESFEAELKKAFDARTQNYIFSDDVANQICYDLYLPLLK